MVRGLKMLSRRMPWKPANLRVLAVLASVCVALNAASAPDSQAPTLTSTQAFFVGMCDASAAVALNNDLFAVANDEDNSLRIYSAIKGGLPVFSRDLSRILKVDSKKPETDLEGACWLGDHIYWISYHGRNKEGEFRESRHRFFATKVEEKNGQFQLAPVGRIYMRLLSDFLADPRLHDFQV